MTTTTANKLTDEDYQLSEVNQLGTLLEVYRLQPIDLQERSELVDLAQLIVFVGELVRGCRCHEVLPSRSMYVSKRLPPQAGKMCYLAEITSARNQEIQLSQRP